MKTDPQDEQQRAAASRRLADTLQRHGVAQHRPAPLLFVPAALVVIALFLYLVWAAARKRNNWARWALVVSFGLSILSLADVLSDQGWTVSSMIDVCSSALTAWGLYASFTGDAKDWFSR